MMATTSASPMNHNGHGVSLLSGHSNKHEQTTTATASEQTTTSVNTPPRKRSCRMFPPSQGWTAVDSNNGPTSSIEKTKKKASVEKKKEKDDQEDMDWICSQCKEAECMIEPEATEFLLCDGKCNRIFHYPCAGLNELPQSDQDWFCKDCTNQRHQCSLCQEFGKDDEDVFLCSKDRCGLFFHESCLSMQNVDVTMVKKGGSCIVNESEAVDTGLELDEELEVATVPVFTCPAHWCWTCTQTIHEEANLNADEEDTSPQNGKAGKNAKKKGRKKAKRSIQSLYFQCKTSSRLFRCLECPRAYHVTCMPPPSRFHELAVLCHEHAMTHKLPELDIATSIQGSVEDKIDRKLLQLNRQNKRRKGDGFKDPLNCANRFFHGMRGDRLISEERYLLDSLSSTTPVGYNDKAFEDATIEDLVLKNTTTCDRDADLRFCLPCDLKDEVHSKPPSYKHIHSLQYDPTNRPKRITTEETCQCSGNCGDRCLNRLSMIECCGEGKASNCSVGDKCGNRSMGKRLSAKCKPKREGGKGWGLVAVKGIKRGMLVQEYMGEVIDESTKRQRLDDWAREHPNDPNFYIMALPSGWYIDARHEANLSRFINHSCDPNCKLETVNVRGYMRCGIYAKRDISPGEFLSYDYHFDTKHADKFVCRCGAKNCRGTMKGGERVLDDVAFKKAKTLALKEARTRLEADRRFLDDLKGKDTKSLVDVLVPAAEQPFESVSSGPQDRYRADAVRNRLFLWRNALRGADYATRFATLDSMAEANKNEYEVGATSNYEKPSCGESLGKQVVIDAVSLIRKHN